MTKRVAVVGGGIFGVTAALYAARAGHSVELFEELPDLLQAASGINQYRLHRGYHYPRSSQTARSALAAEASFIEEYGSAVIRSGRHLYAIAREGSMVSAERFLAFCDDHGLPYSITSVPELIAPDAVETVIEASEARFDPRILREEAGRKLREAGIAVHVDTSANQKLLEPFDKVIVAAYAKTNNLFKGVGDMEPYQFEVCEKPVVRLPDAFLQTDLVIMDGPFMCVDPLGTEGEYVLGNVVHAIHSVTVGVEPAVPPALRPLLNRGIVKDPPVTNYPRFIESGKRFVPLLEKAEHVGSMYTIRTVLPKQEATDARPTLVRVVDEKFIKIFSGKIGNCVLAAKEAALLI